MLDYSSLFNVAIMIGGACLLATIFLTGIFVLFFVIGEGAKRIEGTGHSAGDNAEAPKGHGSH